MGILQLRGFTPTMNNALGEKSYINMRDGYNSIGSRVVGIYAALQYLV